MSVRLGYLYIKSEEVRCRFGVSVIAFSFNIKS